MEKLQTVKSKTLSELTDSIVKTRGSKSDIFTSYSKKLNSIAQVLDFILNRKNKPLWDEVISESKSSEKWLEIKETAKILNEELLKFIGPDGDFTIAASRASRTYVNIGSIGIMREGKSEFIAQTTQLDKWILPRKKGEHACTTASINVINGSSSDGKTEIARRLAKLVKAPFIKVEATKYTEVGYVGRDVDSMVRDLVEASMRVTKQSKLEEKYYIADKIVEEKIVEAIIPGKKKKPAAQKSPFDFIMNSGGYQSQKQQYLESQAAKEKEAGPTPEDLDTEMAREQVREQLRQGLLEDQFIEIEVVDAPQGNQLDMSNEGMSIAIGNIFGNMMPEKTKKKNCKVKDARKILRAVAGFEDALAKTTALANGQIA